MRARISITLLLAASVHARLLPDALGEFTGKASPLPIRARDKALFAEYGLLQAERCVYSSAAGRAMTAELYRFADSRGGRGAYLWMQPQPAVRSPIMSRWTGAVGPIAAVTGSGRTVAGWRNFVLVFRGGSPDHETIDRLLRTMPDPDAALEIDQDSDWIDSSSERLLLGPESLSRFAPEIPPSVAAFRLGGWGRIARSEMPSGAMTRIVFEYPDETIADGRVAAFESLRGFQVRAEGTRVALVGGAKDVRDAEMLLSAAFPGREGTVTFDFASFSCGQPLTVGDGIAGMFFAGLIGAFFGAIRRLADDAGLRDRTTKLNLDTAT